jgi:hypothetical protein
VKTLLDAESTNFSGNIGSADCQKPSKKPWRLAETATPNFLSAPQSQT